MPACDALIPLFAIRPIATAVSSMLYPRAPATGATYLNVSPIFATSVFVALLCVTVPYISSDRSECSTTTIGTLPLSMDFKGSSPDTVHLWNPSMIV